MTYRTSVLLVLVSASACARSETQSVATTAPPQHAPHATVGSEVPAEPAASAVPVEAPPGPAASSVYIKEVAHRPKPIGDIDTRLREYFPKKCAKSAQTFIAYAELDIDASGRPIDIRTRHAPKQPFREACNRFLESVRWEPGRDSHGRPVGVHGIRFQCGFDFADKDDDDLPVLRVRYREQGPLQAVPWKTIGWKSRRLRSSFRYNQGCAAEPDGCVECYAPPHAGRDTQGVG